MAFKPNYNQQRSDRNRAKQLKKQSKLQRREEDAAKRRAARGEIVGGEAGTPDPQQPSSESKQ
jgi:hypothetical protein